MNYLIGHLIGDYLLQNDFMALNKKNKSWVCALHCSIYTLAIAGLTRWAYPALLMIFITHFIIDRWELIQGYMSLMGQNAFAQPPLAPWSIIIVDNSFHLSILYLISKW